MCLIRCDKNQAIEKRDGFGAVQRPISFAVTLLAFEKDLPFPDVRLSHQWSSQSVRSFWSMGYKLSDFVRLFDAIPQSMSHAMAKMLVALDGLNARNRSEHPNTSAF